MKPFRFLIKLLAFLALALILGFIAYKDIAHFAKAQWRLTTIAALVAQGEQTPGAKGECDILQYLEAVSNEQLICLVF